MTINGKRNDFLRADLLAVAKVFGIKGAAEILDHVAHAVARWDKFAMACGVSTALKKRIAATHRRLNDAGLEVSAISSSIRPSAN